MQKLLPKFLSGIFLAIFIVVFGVQSVLADGDEEPANPAPAAGQCDTKCTGPSFKITTSFGGSIISEPESDDLHEDQKNGKGVKNYAPYKDSWCKPGKNGGEGKFVVSKKHEGKFFEKGALDFVPETYTWHRCKGDFDWNGYIIDSLQNSDSIFLKPLGIIVWVISKFFEIIAGYLTTFVNFALFHAFSFFSSDLVKKFIFDLWYSFATLVFSLYLVIVAVSAFQLMLGIDTDHMAVKKLLSRIFGSVVITGFSFVYFLVMLDLGNIFTTVIYGTFGIDTDGINQVATTISEKLAPGGIENISGAFQALPDNLLLFISGATVVIFTGLLLLAFLSLSFVLIKRTLILFVAAILGPFAGLAYAIPSAQSYTEKWFKIVAHHAILPAILAFFIGIAIQGADLITAFFSATNFDQKLFSAANFEDGGIKLSNLMIIAWVASCVFFGSTRAIKAEYTEDAINLAKGLGDKVHGFFKPALEKTAIFAGVGGAATGAFGGTAAAVTWGAAGYKGLGMGYNATEQKIMEIGKKPIETTKKRLGFTLASLAYDHEGKPKAWNISEKFTRSEIKLDQAIAAKKSKKELSLKERAAEDFKTDADNFLAERGGDKTKLAPADRAKYDQLRGFQQDFHGQAKYEHLKKEQEEIKREWESKSANFMLDLAAGGDEAKEIRELLDKASTELSLKEKMSVRAIFEHIRDHSSEIEKDETIKYFQNRFADFGEDKEIVGDKQSFMGKMMAQDPRFTNFDMDPKELKFKPDKATGELALDFKGTNAKALASMSTDFIKKYFNSFTEAQKWYFLNPDNDIKGSKRAAAEKAQIQIFIDDEKKPAEERQTELYYEDKTTKKIYEINVQESGTEKVEGKDKTKYILRDERTSDTVREIIEDDDIYKNIINKLEQGKLKDLYRQQVVKDEMEARKEAKETAEKAALVAKAGAEKAPKDSETEKRKKILDSIVIPDKLEMES